MFSALIIDADGKTPATIKSILAPYGFEFTVTENGPEAVNVARQAAPDIILLRAELPLTTGFSVCNRLRRNDDTKRVPLVLYSSNASDDVIEQHRNLKTHADQYLRLPLDPDRLLTAMRLFLDIPEAQAGAQSVAQAAAQAAAQAGAQAGAQARPHSRSRGHLEVELREPSGASPAPPPAPQQQFDREFGQEFGNLADVRDDDPPAPAARPAARSEPSGETEVGGFKAQREALGLKSQLNAKNREILALKDDLEIRERAILDAKKHQRELQAQIGELEGQLLGLQEQVLSAQEQTEAAQRDKQTALKREEGLKSRLDVALKKHKDLEAHLASFQQQAATSQAEAQQRIAVQSSLLADLETERDNLAASLHTSSEQVLALEQALAASRDDVSRLTAELEQTHLNTQAALDEAAEDKASALAAAADNHRAELDAQAQAHAAALAKLYGELEALREHAEHEREQQAQRLVEAEENARLQITQLTQTLSATEDSARAEIQRLTDNLATAEANAHAEIERLQQTVDETATEALAQADFAANRHRELEAQIRELSDHLERRREAALHAQQALAVALRVLDVANGAGSAS